MLHRKSDKIPIGKGFGQGNTMSPVLFTACLRNIFRELDWEELGIKANGEYLGNLQFADAIALLSN